MKTITKPTIALTLVATAALAFITPSLARDMRGVGPQAYFVNSNPHGAYAYDDHAYRSRTFMNGTNSYAYDAPVYGTRGYGYRGYASTRPHPTQNNYGYGYGYTPGADAYASQDYTAYPQCWTDDGYGRYATCDGAGGGN